MWRRYPMMILLGAAAALAPGTVRAQVLEITPYYGYRLGGEFSDVYNTGVDNIEVRDGDVWGIILTINLTPAAQLEMQYSQQSTTLQGSGFVFDPAGADLGDLNVENWLFGATYTGGRPQDPARGFIGASLGVTNFEPGTANFFGDAYFAFGLYGGVKVALGKHAGLRLQGQWVSTWVGSSSDVICDPYGFCYTVQDGGYLNQFEVAAGLTIKF